jgi:hypothetical protein
METVECHPRHRKKEKNGSKEGAYVGGALENICRQKVDQRVVSAQDGKSK